MRYDDEHKGRVRRTLIERASRVVRSDGVAGTSVSRVMGAAGMTVGGFYRHFDSQQALVGEALAEAMRDARGRLFHGLEDLRGAAFERALVERYLSAYHFENPELGCPIASTVSELGRMPGAVGPLVAEIDDLMAFVAERVEPRPSGEIRAWSILSSCVGALGVARAMGAERGPALLVELRESLLSGLRSSAGG